MKKALLVLGLIFCASVAKAQAIDSQVVKSTWAVQGIKCSSGTTAVQLNATRPTGFGGKVVGYTIQNQDGGDEIYLSGSTSLSTFTLANLGLKVAAGASVDLQLGYKIDQGNPLLPVYCLAADAAGAAGVNTILVWYGL